jgi:hypothetical protein
MFAEGQLPSPSPRAWRWPAGLRAALAVSPGGAEGTRQR